MTTYHRFALPHSGVSKAIIFIVDSADRVRTKTLAQEFAAVVKAGQLKDAAILILANKQDLPGAMDKEELAKVLDVEK
jgi:signal recognition particle receptor subunit beta